MEKVSNKKEILKKVYSEGSKNYQSKNDEFLILTKTKKTIEYINNIIENYPKKYINLISRIENTCFDLLEVIHYYIVNFSNNTYRKKYLKEYIVKISILDDLIGISYNNKLITSKKLKSVSNYIIELRKMCYGLIKNEKE